MAHFAKISEQNEVIQVVVVDNKDTTNGKGVEEELVGQTFLEKHSNWPANLWIQTSYNTKAGTHNSGDNSKAFRGTYAGIGYLWDAANNIFHAPKPYASWILDTATARWHSPIGDAPDDLTDEEKAVNTYYAWNDANGSWDKTTPAA